MKEKTKKGVKTRKFKKKGDSTGVRHHPHYFRHNFATLCYYNGVDVLTAAAWLGHKDRR